jgi:hypothetical protein
VGGGALARQETGQGVQVRGDRGAEQYPQLVLLETQLEEQRKCGEGVAWWQQGGGVSAIFNTIVNGWNISKAHLLIYCIGMGRNKLYIAMQWQKV